MQAVLLEQILKQYFGYSQFRPGQREIIEQLLTGRDTLGIMPTGQGKSVCYQIPALAKEGVVLVFSPLISLMKDQVDTLRQMGISSAYINSSLSPDELDDVFAGVRKNAYRLVYIAPERLESEGFCQLLQSLPISMIAVDEAHCVSQWGHDFRPSYTKIAEVIDSLPVRPVVGAFTATATQAVKADIIRSLKLRNPFEILAGFDRENLYFAVEKPDKKLDFVFDFLQQRKNEAGIIYCATRKNVELVWENLCANGYRAVKYHAGLSDAVRTESQDAFLYDRASIMVATNAFGMGIDKSNVRYILHYNMPKTLENYYQEAGRAGRDGEPARCVLLYAQGDTMINRLFIERSSDPDTSEQYEKLSQMVAYCHVGGCLRGYILRYFGDNPASENCSNCSNCTGETRTEDMTVDAQKILSCVKRMGERFGAAMVAQVLGGSKAAKIRELSFTSLSTYGIMKEYSAAQIKEMIGVLVSEGYLVQEDAQFPVLRLTPDAYKILRGEQTVQRRKIVLKPQSPAHTSIENSDEQLFMQLSALRRRLAEEERVPPYVVFSDRTLREMSARYPVNAEQMIEISGVGESKLGRYGDLFIAEIVAYVEQNDIELPDVFPSAHAVPKQSKPRKVSGTAGDLSRQQTLALFNEGLSLEQIAQRRGLAQSTICGHLCDCMKAGCAVDYRRVVPEEWERLTIQAAGTLNAGSLRAIKDNLPPEIPYDAIRMVLIGKKLWENEEKAR